MQANIADVYLSAGYSIFQGKWCRSERCLEENTYNTRWLMHNGLQWQQHHFVFDIHRKRRLA